MKIKIIETECDCPICQYMCHAPCCGTPVEVEMLIKAGFDSRLMLDDNPDDVYPEPVIKPALKGYEGKRAPYHVASHQGCTFWKDGKCELHSLGLKPYLGRVAHHAQPLGIYEAACEKVNKAWGTKKAKNLIEKFKESMGIPKREEE